MRRKIIVGMSGATGALYGVRLLMACRNLADVETHLICSEAAKLTLAPETEFTFAEVAALADRVHDNGDLSSPLASGSHKTHGMAILPCSIKTLSGVATSHADNLLVRAADVTLKERRPLVLGVRETPLHKGHLKLMHAAADIGAVIVPPMLALYSRPKTVEEVVDHGVARILDHLGIETDLVPRWEGA